LFFFLLALAGFVFVFFFQAEDGIRDIGVTYRLSIAAKTPADLRPIFQEVIPLVSHTDLDW